MTDKFSKLYQFLASHHSQSARLDLAVSIRSNHSVSGRMQARWSRSAVARAVQFCWYANAFSGSDIVGSAFGYSKTEVLPIRTISGLRRTKRWAWRAWRFGLDMVGNTTWKLKRSKEHSDGLSKIHRGDGAQRRRAMIWRRSEDRTRLATIGWWRWNGAKARKGLPTTNCSNRTLRRSPPFTTCSRSEGLRQNKLQKGRTRSKMKRRTRWWASSSQFKSVARKDRLNEFDRWWSTT